MRPASAILILFAAFSPTFFSCGDEGNDGQRPTREISKDDKLVLAFYYPWYRTPSYSGFWSHWNDEGHDPETFVETGRRDIASANYPDLDVYDSLDPDVIDRHIQQSVDAGIDAWIISWWGDSQEIQAILNRIVALKSPLKVTAYYEQIPGCLSRLCEELSDAEKISTASEDIIKLLETLSADPSWLTVEDEAVLFVYIRAIAHGLSNWKSIIQQIESTQPVFLSGDATLTQTWTMVAPEFDQMHVYNPTWQMSSMGEGTLRYGEFCKQSHNRGQSCALPVIPGYDDSALPSREAIVIERDGGTLYNRFWKNATEADADWILITSFNEWHEGSEIEPSLEHGDAYLKETASLSKSFTSGSTRSSLW